MQGSAGSVCEFHTCRQGVGVNTCRQGAGGCIPARRVQGFIPTCMVSGGPHTEQCSVDRSLDLDLALQDT